MRRDNEAILMLLTVVALLLASVCVMVRLAAAIPNVG